MMGAMVVARVSARAVPMVDGIVVARVVAWAYARKLLELTVGKFLGLILLQFYVMLWLILRHSQWLMVGWLLWLI